MVYIVAVDCCNIRTGVGVTQNTISKQMVVTNMANLEDYNFNNKRGTVTLKKKYLILYNCVFACTFS